MSTDTCSDLVDAVRISLINEVPSDEAWRDLNDAYDAALATPEPALDVERLLQAVIDTEVHVDRLPSAVHADSLAAEYARLAYREADADPR